MAITISIIDDHGGIAHGTERVITVNGDRDEIIAYGRTAGYWQGLPQSETEDWTGADALMEVLCETVTILQLAAVDPPKAEALLHRLGRPPYDFEGD